MKKRLLSAAMCLCMATALVTGCAKDSDKKDKSETKTSTEEETIAVEDDNAEALHAILMERTGDYALKYADISDYTGLAIEAEAQEEITDEKFLEELDSLLEYYPYVFSGEVVSGETVNIDYEGTVDGVAFDGGTASGASLTIGSGQFIDGFEEQLIGMQVGDTRVIDVTFPDPYERNTDLSGAQAQFKVTLNYRELTEGKAELSEQWVQAYLDNTGAILTDASVDGFKAYFRENLEQDAADTRETNVKNAMLEKLIELVEIKDAPEAQTEFYKNLIEKNVEANIQSSYSMTLDQYMEQTGMTQDQYDEQIASIADSRMKYEYALIVIGEKEKLAPTEEEYTAVLQEYADYNSYTVEEFRTQYQSSYQLDLYFEAYADKVLDKLLESAVITEPAADETSGDAVSAE